MSTPSDLLRKANTSQYVINPAASGVAAKNPAYYMQPPRANSSVWVPDPMHRASIERSADNPTLQNPATQNQAMPPKMPDAQNAGGTWAYIPYQQETAYQPAEPMRYPAQPPMKAPAQPIENRAPVVEKDGMRVTVQPPQYPAPPIARREPAIYRQLMEKHDRAVGGKRYVK